MLLPEQCRAGRALLGWSQADLQVASGVAKKTIAAFEAGGRVAHDANREKLAESLEAAGVVLIPQNGGGAGVRLASPAPRLVRRLPVEERKWVAFAFDFRGERHTAFVTFPALKLLARESEPVDAFDLYQSEILAAASRWPVEGLDAEGRTVLEESWALALWAGADPEE